MQAEIKRINDENQRQKAEMLAQEKLADQMVMEFTKKKMVGTWGLMPELTGLSSHGTLAGERHAFIVKYRGLAFPLFIMA